MIRRSVTIAGLVIGAGVISVVGAGAAIAGCADHFPDETWVISGETELLTVATAEVPEGQALRFAEEAAATVALLEADLGTLPPLDLCVAGIDTDLDATGIVPDNQSLHAVVFAPDGTVLVSALEAALFDEAHSFGLAYAALWGVGDTPYPEPLATTISQWYLSRVAGKLDLHHSQMRGGAFFRDPSGEGVATTDWTASTQTEVYPWNPEFQESPIADLVEYAVATEGPGVLRDTTNEQWSALEQAWQASLREEALQGSSSGNAWIVGLAIFVGMIVLAGVLAWLNHVSKRKFKDAARLKTSR